MSDPCPVPTVKFTPWQGCGNGVGNLETNDTSCGCVSAAGGGGEVSVSVDPTTFIGEYILCTPSNKMNLQGVEFCRGLCWETPTLTSSNEVYTCQAGVGGAPSTPPAIPAWAIPGSGGDDEADTEALFGPDGLIIYDFHCTVIETEAVDVINAGTGCAGSAYVITRTWTVYSNKGLADEESFSFDQTFTWEDTAGPSFNETLPSDITIECSDAVPTAPSITSTDECSGPETVTLNEVADLSGCNGTGTITRTWSATDDCGTVSSHIQVITVQDSEAPTFTAPSDIEIFTDTDCNYDASILITGDATDIQDNCSTGLVASFNDVTTLNDPCTGAITITRTWTLEDECNNAATEQIQVITITDNLAPIAPSAPADETYQCADDVPAATSLTATDNCSADITVNATESTNGGSSCAGDILIITRLWTFVDDCNNESSVEQIITVGPCPLLCIIPELDVNQTPQDVPVSGNVLTNDTDPQGGTLMVTGVFGLDVNGNMVSIPVGVATVVYDENGNIAGEIIINDDGSYTFTPEPGFTGSVPLEYEVTDDSGAFATTSLGIEVLPTADATINDLPPVANDDSGSTESGESTNGDVFGNDFEQEEESFSITNATAFDINGDPVNLPLGVATIIYDENGNLAGTMTLNSDGTYTFDADPAFTGTVPIEYTITDEDGLTDDATLSINVLDSAINNTFANDDSSVGIEDLPQEGNVITNDTDPESNSQTVTGGSTSDGTPIIPNEVIVLPSGGTIIIYSNGLFEYNPAPGFVGTEVITYIITDANGAMDTATLTLTTLPDEALILPVELVKFDVTIQNNKNVILEWTTLAEVNNDYFSIEYSLNGHDFRPLATINSLAENGNSNELLKYSYSDVNAVSRSNQLYYRLKQNDFNGDFFYSDTKRILFENVSNGAIVYPNPADNGEIISVKGEQIKTIRIMNYQGVLVDFISTQNPQKIVTLETTQYKQGLYYMVVNENEVIKFVVL